MLISFAIRDGAGQPARYYPFARSSVRDARAHARKLAAEGYVGGDVVVIESRGSQEVRSVGYRRTDRGVLPFLP